MKKLETEISISPVRLSIVVISIYSHQSLISCLDSILACENQDKIEIIVANSSSDNSFPYLDIKYPRVRFLQFPQNMGIPDLSAEAITQTSGEIIALTDSSCLVDGDWITSILKAHQSKSAVVGGRVEIHGLTKAVDWAAYFCEYGEFMRPLRAGVVDALPGNNISFKRSALLIGNEYVKNKFWKTFWCQKLRAEGIELISEPSMLVYYTKNFRLISFLTRRFHHGRCFAGMRAIEFKFIKRIIYLGGSVFLPFIFLYRVTSTIVGKKRRLKELLLSFPLIVLAIIFWSLGETCGFLAGTGKSCEYIR